MSEILYKVLVQEAVVKAFLFSLFCLYFLMFASSQSNIRTFRALYMDLCLELKSTMYIPDALDFISC